MPAKFLIKNVMFFMSLFLVCLAPQGVLALPGDIDESGRVDGFDLIIFSKAFATHSGDTHWNDQADLNQDGGVNDADLEILRQYFGHVARSQGCWVADTSGNRALFLGAQGGNIVRKIEDFGQPVAIAFNLANNAVWIADTGTDEIVRMTFAQNGTSFIRTVKGVQNPAAVAVNSLDGSCWVADTGNNRIVRLSDDVPDGYDLTNATGYHVNVQGFSSPQSVSVNSADGSCWVADSGGGQVVKLNPNVPMDYNIGMDSGYHTRVIGLSSPWSVSVNSVDGTCWVADSGNNRVVLVAQTGTNILRSIDGFSTPRSVSANPLENSCWVANTNAGEIVKLNRAGQVEQFRISGFNTPMSVSVELASGACWVADSYNDAVVKISTNGEELLRKKQWQDISAIRPLCVFSVPSEEPARLKRPTALAEVTRREGLTVTCDASSSFDVDGKIVRYEWDFDGDGIYDFLSADETVATHTYQQPGIYTPILRVTDNDWLSDLDSTHVVQLGELTASLEVDPVNGTAPLRANFTVNSIDPIGGRIVNYRIDYNGDGEFDDFWENLPTSIQYIYQVPGTYSAVLQVTNDAGDTARDTASITVNPAGPHVSAYANPSSGSAPLTTQLTGYWSDQDGSIELFQWDFDADGIFDWFSVSTGNTWNTYFNNGTYIPKLQVMDNSGLKSSATTTVDVAAAPVALPTAALEASLQRGTAPLLVTFSASESATPAGTIESYVWDFGDGSTATGAEVTHSYTTNGTFDVGVTVTSSLGGTDRASTKILVQPAGSPLAVAEASPNAGLAPLTVQLRASNSTDTDGQIVSYAWDVTGPFQDDMEYGSGNWVPDNPWAIVTVDDAPSGTHCWTDSPDGDYADNVDSSLMTRPFDLTNSDQATLVFAHKYALSWYGSGLVEISTDMGDSWTELMRYTGARDDWSEARISLADYLGQSGLLLRFRLLNEYSYNADGWYIDDVQVEGAVGQFDVSTADPGVTYPRAGVYHPLVRVVDNDGKISQHTAQVWVQAKPEATIDRPYAGQVSARQDVSFSGHGSDADGRIELYEWDFDGDGVFDWSSKEYGTTQHTLESNGTYTAFFRITDDQGLQDTQSVTYTIASFPPQSMQASADIMKGNAPLQVHFDGSAADTDGAIRMYEWDFDGDGIMDWGSAGAGRLVSFSTQRDDSSWSAANLIDGKTALNESRGWSSGYRPSYPQELVFSLAHDKAWTIDRISINPQTTESSTYWAKDVQVLVSQDGLANNDFAPVHDGNFTLSTEAGFQDLLVNATSARYVKIRVLSNHGSAYYAELGEVAVYSGHLNVVSPIGANAVYTYATPGTYHPVLKATDDQGLSSDTTLSVHILPDDQTQVFALALPASTLTQEQVRCIAMRTYDDFSNATMSDGLWDNGTSSGDWQVNDGLLKQVSNYGNNAADANSVHFGTYMLSTGSSSNWSDYALSTKVRATDNDSMGLIIRYQGPGAYYLLEWDAQNNYQRLVKRTADGVVELARRNTGYDHDRWYNVVLVAEGNSLSVLVDNEQVLQATDSDIGSGRFGLWCNYNDETHFDDVRVSWLDQGTFAWDFDNDGTFDGTQADNGMALHAYTVPGTYHARVQLTDAHSMVDEDTVSVVVRPRSLAQARAWMADPSQDTLFQIAADGKTVLKEISGFYDPQYVSVHKDGTCWVADRYGNKVVKIAADVPSTYNIQTDRGFHQIFTGFTYPTSLEVDTRDGACWVVDQSKDRLVKIPDSFNASRSIDLELIGSSSGQVSGPAKIFGHGANATEGFLGQGLNLPNGPYISLPAECLDGASDFTIEAWFEHSFDRNAPLFSGASGSDDDALLLEVDNDGTSIFLNLMGASRLTYTSPVPLNDGDFHHLALVRSGRNATVYVDGTLAGDKVATNATLRIDSGGFIVGREQNSLGGNLYRYTGLDGGVDELRCWTVARTKEQIQSASTTQLSGDETGLSGYWPLNRVDPVEDSVVRVSGFSSPQVLAIDQTDGVVWVTDGGYDDVFQIQENVPDGYNVSSNATHHVRLEGFSNPSSIDVVLSDGTAWVADSSNNQIVHVAGNGTQELGRLGGFEYPSLIQVNQSDDSLWVLDARGYRLQHLDADGSYVLAEVTAYGPMTSLDIDLLTGECWAADTGYPVDNVKRFAPNCNVLSQSARFSDPRGVAVLSAATTVVGQDGPTIDQANTNATSGLEGTSISFQASASDQDGVVSYEWDFEGDGTFDSSSPSPDVTHVYDRPGYYLPALRVTDSDGNAAISQLAPVRIGRITVRASADPGSGPAPLDVDFSASAYDPNGRIVEYAWDFESDGRVDATGKTVQHTYQDHGAIQATLTVTSTSGSFQEVVKLDVQPVPPEVAASATPQAGIPPLAVLLDGEAADEDGSITVSQWDFNGDGIYDWSSSTEQDVTFSYTQAGMYNATFRAIDNDGQASTAWAEVVVNTPPEASFQAQPMRGYAPLSVAFDASPSSDPDNGHDVTSFVWDFGDGTQGNGTRITHSFETAGTYTATLTVQDDLGGVSQTSHDIIVKPLDHPLAQATATPRNGTAPLTVQFSAADSTDDGTIGRYQWSFGGPVYALNQSGYPENQLFVGTWDSTGCSDVTSKQTGIEAIQPSPGAEFADKTWFVASDSDGNLNWDSIFGSSSNAYAYSHIYVFAPSAQEAKILFGADDSARFWVNGRMAFSKSGCEGVGIDQYSFDITLQQGWNRILASVSDGTGGWGLAYRFTDPDGNPLQLFYSLQKPIGDLYSSEANGDVSYTYDNPGTYEPQLLIVDADGNIDVDQVSVFVHPNPSTPTALAAASPLSGDEPLVVSFNGTGTDPDGYIALYEWDFDGDGAFDWNSTQNGVTSSTYTGPGKWRPVLRVTDDAGFRNTDSLEIVCGGSPPVAVPVAYPLTGAAPLRVKFNTKGTDADNTIADFKWDFDGDGTFDFDSPISMTTEHTYKVPGTYMATLQVTDHDGYTDAASVPITVTVPQAPAVQLAADPISGGAPLQVEFTAMGTDLDGTLTAFRWDPGDGSGYTEFTPSDKHTVVYAEPGLYTARVEVQDNEGNAGTDSVLVVVTDPSAPEVQASVSPGQGETSLAAVFSAEVQAAPGDSITRYAWDFDGDGKFDWSTASSTVWQGTEIVHTYTQSGTYHAVLQVTAQSGLVGLDTVTISVRPGFKIWRETESFDPTVQQSMPLRLATSTAITNLELKVIDEHSEEIRTLIQDQDLAPGAYDYIWDGRDNEGTYVESGVYYFLAEYDAHGQHYVYDMTNTEGFERQTPGQQYQNTFDPLNGEQLDVRFSLAKPAVVSMYVFAWNYNQDVRTIYLKQPMTSGQKVISWDGTRDDGTLIPTDTSYTISTSAWYLPDNAIVVQTHPKLSNIVVTPNYYNPSLNPYIDQNLLNINFSLTKAADVQAVILDANNEIVKDTLNKDLPSGPNTLHWNGRNEQGKLLAPGFYRVRLNARDNSGYLSLPVYTVFSLFY